jgi:hypothetical protein
MGDDVGLLISASMLTANLREAEFADSVRKRETSFMIFFVFLPEKRTENFGSEEAFLFRLMRRARGVGR